MTTNNYFQQGLGLGEKTEQELVQDATDELIQMSGFDFYYVPRNLVKTDKIFGEDVLSTFTKYYTIEMYFNNINDWGGQDDLLSKFGLAVDQSAELICSRRRFLQETATDYPKEGDLIYFPLTRSLFQIDRVEFENPFYILSKQYTFMIKCSLYSHSYETFDTGIEAVDESLGNDFDPLFGENEEINTEAAEDIDFSEEFPFGKIVEE